MKAFASRIKSCFAIGKVILDDKINFNSCSITQDLHGNIKMSMKDYLSAMKPAMLDPVSQDQPESVSKNEVQDYRRLAGELVWIGSRALPQASYFRSVFQQRVPILTRDFIFDAIRDLKQLKKLHPCIKFSSTDKTATKIELISFSDASYNISQKHVYCQSGVISGVRYRSDQSDAQQLHVIYWTSYKQKRVYYSAYGAEILACTTAEDRGYAVKVGIEDLFPNMTCVHHIRTDSKALFDTITSLQEFRVYRLPQTVQQLRDAFESRKLNEIRWIQSHENIADALTKNNPDMHKLLNEVTTSGLLCLPNHHSQELHSATWT